MLLVCLMQIDSSACKFDTALGCWGSNSCWLQKKQLTLKNALELVQQARPSANPNAGFMTQLLRLEQKLHGRKTVKVSCKSVSYQCCCQAGALYAACYSALRSCRCMPSAQACAGLATRDAGWLAAGETYQARAPNLQCLRGHCWHLNCLTVSPHEEAAPLRG